MWSYLQTAKGLRSLPDVKQWLRGTPFASIRRKLLTIGAESRPENFVGHKRFESKNRGKQKAPKWQRRRQAALDKLQERVTAAAAKKAHRTRTTKTKQLVAARSKKRHFILTEATAVGGPASDSEGSANSDDDDFIDDSDVLDASEAAQAREELKKWSSARDLTRKGDSSDEEEDTDVEEAAYGFEDYAFVDTEQNEVSLSSATLIRLFIHPAFARSMQRYSSGQQVRRLSLCPLLRGELLLEQRHRGKGRFLQRLRCLLSGLSTQ